MSAFLLFVICLSVSLSHIKAVDVCDERYCLYTFENATSFKEAENLCSKNNSYMLQLDNSQVKRLFEKFSIENMQHPKEKILLNLQVKTHRWTCINKKKGSFEEFKEDSVFDDTPKQPTFLSVSEKDDGYEILAREEFYRMKVICEVAVSEEMCKKYSFKYFYYNNTCHFLLADTHSWYDANAQCDAENASLVSQDNIAKVFETFKTSFWIKCGTEMWYWKHTNTPVLNAKWVFNRPSSDSSLQCAYLTVIDDWLRSNCTGDYTVLCTKDKHSVSSTCSMSVVLMALSVTYSLFYYN